MKVDKSANILPLWMIELIDKDQMHRKKVRILKRNIRKNSIEQRIRFTTYDGTDSAMIFGNSSVRQEWDDLTI